MAHYAWVMGQDILITRDFPGAPARLWAAWTDPAQLKTWLCEDAHIVLHAGGAFELFWEPAHRERNSTLGCQLREVREEQLLSFTWKGPVEHAAVMNASEPPPTWVQVKFERTPDGTRVTLKHTGFGDGAAWEAARAWQEKAWLGAFMALTSMLAT